MTETHVSWSTLPECKFGSSPQLERRLAVLIVCGRKTATVWDGNEPNPTLPGKYWVVTAENNPVAVIKTMTVEQKRFSEVDDAFALAEGEGDCSLEFWRIVHEDFFRKAGHFDPEMLLWCETFMLVSVLDERLLHDAPEHIEAELAEAVALLRGG